MKDELNEIIEYYCGDNKNIAQSDMIEMLREIQEICGGILSEDALDTVCSSIGVKRSYLSAVMKFVPDLKTETVKHRLEICGGANCHSKDKDNLSAYIEKEYQAVPGKVSEKGSFLFKTGGCMKNCKEGPCVKWDGQIYTKVTKEKLDRIILS